MLGIEPPKNAKNRKNVYKAPEKIHKRGHETPTHDQSTKC